MLKFEKVTKKLETFFYLFFLVFSGNKSTPIPIKP